MSSFILFVLILSVLIVGHEIGHFVVSKSFGIHVEEFGLGYPPRLKKLFTWRGTDFSLNWIPFGGFVRIAGEDDADVKSGFSNASKFQRASILFAGPLANVILAIAAFTIAFKIAAPDINLASIAAVAVGSPAHEAGIEQNDIVISVNDNAVSGILSVQEAISQNLGEETLIQLEREGNSFIVNLVPRANPPVGEGAIGVLLGNPQLEINWFEATQMGFASLRFQVNQILHLPGQLLRGEVSSEEARLTGFKGMYDMVVWAGEIDQTSDRPFLTLNLIGMISTGFALANLLPIPALDGGRLMFILLEIILRKRVPAELEGAAHAIGFLIMIGLLIYVNLQDFINPIILP